MDFNAFLQRIISDIQNRLKMLYTGGYDPRQHILDTYFSTRIGIAIISILFPLILWLVGLKFDVELQGSISAYYHTSMRNVFVGSLFAIGTSLYLYKGYSTEEDLVLDGAGICAVCVALLPTSCPDEFKCNTFTAPVLHGVSAILFFILIAYICIFKSSDTLDKEKLNIPDLEKIDRKNKLSESQKKCYRRIYRILGVLMVSLPLFSALWLYFIGETGSLIFWVELAGVLVFSLYWIVKTWEIDRSQLEK